MTNLQVRTISGVILGAVTLGATLLGGFPFVFVVAVMALAIWVEWFDMTCPNGDDRVRLLGFLVLAVIIVAALFVADGAVPLVAVAAAAAFYGISAIWAGGLWPVAGILYSAGAFVSLVTLRGTGGLSSGFVALVFLFAVVWSTDTGAYFAGRHFGGPRIAPAISPNKTWSGAIGGIAAAVVAGIIVVVAAGSGSAGGAALLAGALSVVSQFGDFFESWIKRRNGVKDSGNIIPGHGGMMDRVDGLAAAAMALWIMSAWVAGFGHPSAAFFTD